MEPVSSFFKEEEDVFFQRGREKERISLVKNLLTTDRFTISEITSLGNVTEEFVQNIKDQLQ